MLGDFLQNNCHVQHLDLSGSVFSGHISKLSPSLCMNYSLQVLALYECGINKRAAEAFFCEIASCKGLVVQGIPVARLARLQNEMVFSRRVVIPKHVEIFNTLWFADCPSVSFNDDLFSKIPFLESLTFQRSPSIGKNPEIANFPPFEKLVSLTMVCCQLREITSLLSHPFSCLKHLNLQSNSIRNLSPSIAKVCLSVLFFWILFITLF